MWEKEINRGFFHLVHKTEWYMIYLLGCALQVSLYTDLYFYLNFFGEFITFSGHTKLQNMFWMTQSKDTWKARESNVKVSFFHEQIWYNTAKWGFRFIKFSRVFMRCHDTYPSGPRLSHILGPCNFKCSSWYWLHIWGLKGITHKE